MAILLRINFLQHHTTTFIKSSFSSILLEHQIVAQTPLQHHLSLSSTLLQPPPYLIMARYITPGTANSIKTHRPEATFWSYNLDQYQYLTYWISQRQHMRTLAMRLVNLKTSAEKTKYEVEAMDRLLSDLQCQNCSSEFIATESEQAVSRKSALQQHLQDLKFQAREIRIQYRTHRLNAEKGQLD